MENGVSTAKRDTKKTDKPSSEEMTLPEKVDKGIDNFVDRLLPKIGFTLDDCTVQMLDELRRPTLASRSLISRTIIEEVKESPQSFAIAQFYEQTWRKTYFNPEHLKRGIQLTLNRELNVFLLNTSKQILGEQNRSEMLRILVALYAFRKGVAQFVPPTEGFVIKITPLLNRTVENGR